MLRRAIPASLIAIVFAAGGDLHAQRPNLHDFDAYMAKGVRDWVISGEDAEFGRVGARQAGR